MLFGEHRLRHAIREYVEHYHIERNHQGLDNHLIQADPQINNSRSEIEHRERLGGVLKFYHRQAA